MRRRNLEELNSPERIARLSAQLHPTNTPKSIRNYIRNHYVVDLVDFLYDVAMGEQKFEVLNARGEVVEITATPAVRKECAVAVVNFATIGANVHMLGDDGEATQGAIALPEVELRHQQRRLHATAQPVPQLNGSAEVVEDEYTVPVNQSPANGNGNGAHNGNGTGQ